MVRDHAGRSAVEALHAAGLTGKHVRVVHGVWLSSDERRLLRETGTHLVHCPTADRRLGNGLARVPELLHEGVSVALGVESAACNEATDGFAELRLTALIHKAKGGPGALPAASVLRLATVGGARALGLADVGVIAPGFRADLVLLDLAQPHFTPVSADLVTRVVYAGRSADVRSVIVDGKVVVEDGTLTTAVLRTILAEAQRAARAVQARLA